MLSRELMGLLALGVLWVNTLLISAAAWKEAMRLLARRSRLVLREPVASGYGLVRGTVVRGEGTRGALASRTVEQLGRAAGDPAERRGILFGDKSTSGESFGGVVDVGGIELAVASASDAEVWIDVARLRADGESGAGADFDVAFEEARRARGFARTLHADIAGGASVWVAGDLTSAGDTRRVTASAEHGLLVSSFDPRAFCARKAALSFLAVAGFVAGAAACTALALTAPRFGTVSTLGGALGLVFFLLVQPAGTALRDAVKLPHLADVRGMWKPRAPQRLASTTTLRDAAGE